MIIDEYSRYPFCFPCPNMQAQTVIKHLNELFTLCGVPGFIHSDNATAFKATAIKNFLNSKGVATSHSSIYHQEGNSQVERSIGSIWRTVKLAIKARHLPINRWESVIPEVLNFLRSLCTLINATPHELFFGFQRKTFCRPSLPTWLMHPGPVLVRNFTRVSKHDDLVQQAELTQANPAYAKVRYPDGREVTVSLEDLAPAPRNTVDSRLSRRLMRQETPQETPSTREVTVCLEDLAPAPRNTVDKTRFMKSTLTGRPLKLKSRQHSITQLITESCPTKLQTIRKKLKTMLLTKCSSFVRTN